MSQGVAVIIICAKFSVDKLRGYRMIYEGSNVPLKQPMITLTAVLR